MSHSGHNVSTFLQPTATLWSEASTRPTPHALLSVDGDEVVGPGRGGNTEAVVSLLGVLVPLQLCVMSH